MITLEQQIPDDATVTPGIEGFAVFALLAVIVLLLVLSMSRHLRKVDTHAAQLEADEADRRAAEEDAAGTAGAAAAPDGTSATEPPATDDPPEGRER